MIAAFPFTPPQSDRAWLNGCHQWIRRVKISPLLPQNDVLIVDGGIASAGYYHAVIGNSGHSCNYISVARNAMAKRMPPFDSPRQENLNTPPNGVLVEGAAPVLVY
jgi:hypothetical protein